MTTATPDAKTGSTTTTPQGPDEDLDLEGYLQGERQRRKRVMMIAAGVVACIVAAVAIYIVLRPEPRCDSDDAKTYLSHKQLPAGVVGEVCRFDPPIADALDAMQASPPDYRRMVMAKALLDARDTLEDICSGGTQALASAMQNGNSASFAEACDLSSLGVGKDDARQYSAERLAFALLIYAQLKDSDASLARPIARTMLSR